MTWKLATFNVNGIRARLGVVLDWLESHRPDVMCLQEIKCQDKDFPVKAFDQAGYTATVRGQKAYNGVAVLSIDQPDETWLELGDGREEDQARFMAAGFGPVWVINTYIPQGRDPADPAFGYKLEYFARLERLLAQRFDPGSPVILTGDLNVAPQNIDVFDPQRMDGRVGFHPAERQALAGVAAWGLVDVFRRLHPDEKQFSFWDYRLPNGFKRNLGWRLDHILATAPLAETALDCRVDAGPRARSKPSDHTPVWAEFDLDKLA